MKIITTENASATQTEHPTRSTLRTFLQSAVFAFPLLLALPEVLSIVDEELGAYLSEDARGWLALAAGVIAAGAAALARVMAVPAIERALRGIGLGAAPAEPDFGHWDGAADEADVDDLDDPDPEPAAEPEVSDYEVDESDGDPAGDDEEPDVEPEEGEVVYDLDESSLEQAAADEVDLTPPPNGWEPKH